MNNLNSILVELTLTKDGELRTTPKGTSILTLHGASVRYFRTDGGYEKEASYFEIEAMGRLAETCLPKAKKGRGLRVVGRLKQDRWTGENGELMSKIIIIPEHIEFKPNFKRNPEAEETQEEMEQHIDLEQPIEEVA